MNARKDFQNEKRKSPPAFDDEDAASAPPTPAVKRVMLYASAPKKATDGSVASTSSFNSCSTALKPKGQRNRVPAKVSGPAPGRLLRSSNTTTEHAMVASEMQWSGRKNFVVFK